VVIDPVDTNRNVAAAVSLDSFSIFLDSARSFLESPCIECFFPQPIPPLDVSAFRAIVKKRKTTVFGVKFDLPDLVDDIAYPQLERAHKAFRRCEATFIMIKGRLFCSLKC
jgi:tRNA nucleotidyltransferase (CCA-adding enzyme)